MADIRVRLRPRGKTWALCIAFISLCLGVFIAAAHALSQSVMWAALAGILIAILSVVQILLIARIRPYPDSLITILRSHVHLRFEKGGTLGYYEKRQEFVANEDGIASIVETALRPEYGQFELLSIIPTGRPSSSILRPKDDPLEIFFDSPPPRGKRLERTIKGVFKDCFPGAREWFEVKVSRIIDEIQIWIEAPSDRLFLDVTVEQIDPLRGAKRLLSEDYYTLEFNQDRISAVKVALIRPRLGYQYRITWSW